MEKLKCILRLFLSMMKIGLFTFGGGYAMINLLDNEFVTKRKWIDGDEFLDLVAVAESTPGPIAINCSTYIGYKKAGFMGALFSTLGMCIPSFFVIFIISLFFDKFLAIAWVAAAFRGIQVAVVFLILSAGVKMLIKAKKKPLNIIIISLTFAVFVTFSLLSVSFSSIFYILIFGTLGVLIYTVGYLKKRIRKGEVDK